MDWGIVASVLVALALFMAAIGILVLLGIGLFVSCVKSRMRKQGNATSKFPDCCSMMKSMHDAH